MEENKKENAIVAVIGTIVAVLALVITFVGTPSKALKFVTIVYATIIVLFLALYLFIKKDGFSRRFINSKLIFGSLLFGFVIIVVWFCIEINVEQMVPSVSSTDITTPTTVPTPIQTDAALISTPTDQVNPLALTVSDITQKSVMIIWENQDTAACAVNVFIGETQLIHSSTTDKGFLLLDDLFPNTSYTIVATNLDTGSTARQTFTTKTAPRYPNAKDAVFGLYYAWTPIKAYEDRLHHKNQILKATLEEFQNIQQAEEIHLLTIYYSDLYLKEGETFDLPEEMEYSFLLRIPSGGVLKMPAILDSANWGGLFDRCYYDFYLETQRLLQENTDAINMPGVYTFELYGDDMLIASQDLEVVETSDVTGYISMEINAVPISDSATLAWKKTKNMRYRVVLTTRDHDHVIFETETPESSVLIEGLAENTDYTVRLTDVATGNSLCADLRTESTHPYKDYDYTFKEMSLSNQTTVTLDKLHSIAQNPDAFALRIYYTSLLKHPFPPMYLVIRTPSDDVFRYDGDRYEDEWEYPQYWYTHSRLTVTDLLAGLIKTYADNLTETGTYTIALYAVDKYFFGEQYMGSMTLEVTE